MGKTETPAQEAKADGTPALPVHESAADENLMFSKKKKKDVTKPTGQPGGRVMGEHPKPLPSPNKGPYATEKNRGTTRENEAAETLASKGYKVEHRSEKNEYDGAKNPDLIVEGRQFDIYSPSTNDHKSILKEIRDKRAQADRQVVYLADTKMTAESLRNQLQRDPIPGLKEVIAIDKSGRVRQAYP